MGKLEDLFYNLVNDKNKGILYGAAKIFLYLFSLLYGVVIKIMIYLARFYPQKLGAKVISVGNITLGGTGKTCLVEYISDFLKGAGRRPAVLTRGYGRKNCEGKPATCDYEMMGDEAYMLSKKLGDVPVIVDADRAKGAKKALAEFKSDTLVLDDGFQQWKLNKDLEIVLIDAVNPFGNHRLIPRGILREPLSSLKRADIFILTKTNINPETGDLRKKLAAINPRADIFEGRHEPRGLFYIDEPGVFLNGDTIKGKKVALFSGIGDPASFENLILSLGAEIGAAFRFPDHHNYSKKDIEKIISISKEKRIDTIVTTEKDAARLEGPEAKILVLRIEIRIKDAEKFNRRLLAVYSI